MIRGLILAAIQIAMLASVGGKFLYDRATLPRCWVRAAPYDPNLPIRGRYISLRLEQTVCAGTFSVAGQVPFFIPENSTDPAWRPRGEELWAEVSVPKKGPPRPIRLGVRKDGVLTPLDIR
jgi:hypothetical protein